MFINYTNTQNTSMDWANHHKMTRPLYLRTNLYFVMMKPLKVNFYCLHKTLKTIYDSSMIRLPKPNRLYFARVNFRDDRRIFGLDLDSAKHTLITGATSAGKSNVIRNFIYQDVIHGKHEIHGRSSCVFDLHNDLIPDVFRHLPHNRNKDVVFLDIPNSECNYRYNILKNVAPDNYSLVVSSIIETFKKIYRSSWGNRLQYILSFILLTLIRIKGTTIADIPKIINDSDFRNSCVVQIQDEHILSFWANDFMQFSKNDLTSVLNKVMEFLGHPSIKRFMVTNTEDISLRQILDKKGSILLINVDKGKLGTEVSRMISSLLMTAIMNAGFSRSNIPEQKRTRVHLYCDEFASYSNDGSVISLLQEIRKYGYSLFLSTQYLSALDSNIRGALLGNVQNIIAFRSSLECGRYYEKIMYPIFKTEDFVSLDNYEIYCRLFVQNKVTKAFSASTIKYFDYF